MSAPVSLKLLHELSCLPNRGQPKKLKFYFCITPKLGSIYNASFDSARVGPNTICNNIKGLHFDTILWLGIYLLQRSGITTASNPEIPALLYKNELARCTNMVID